MFVLRVEYDVLFRLLCCCNSNYGPTKMLSQLRVFILVVLIHLSRGRDWGARNTRNNLTHIRNEVFQLQVRVIDPQDNIILNFESNLKNKWTWIRLWTQTCGLPYRFISSIQGSQNAKLNISEFLLHYVIISEDVPLRFFSCFFFLGGVISMSRKKAL